MSEKPKSSKKLSKEHEMAQRKIGEVKSNGVKLIAADLDGTLYERSDPNFDFDRVVKLAYDVTQTGIEFAIISSRNTTAEIPIRKLLEEFCKKRGVTIKIWRSGGNGMNLLRLTTTPQGTNIQTIYSNTLTPVERKCALDAYLSLNISPDPKSLAFFKDVKSQELPQDLVSKEAAKLAKPYNGVFAENVKISFALSHDEDTQTQQVRNLRKLIEPEGLNVGWGHTPFADVSRKAEIDGKLNAVQHIIEELGITDTQAATFGDAPDGNDAGLLSFPYSFTNHQVIINEDIKTPPFIVRVKNSPIQAIHDSIRQLIATKSL